MGSSKQQTTTTSNSNTAPWSVQQPYLEQAFSGAQGALGQANNNAGTGTYGAPTQFQAQYTPGMMQAFQNELGYGINNGNIAGASQYTGNTMAGAAGATVPSALYGLGTFDPNNQDAATYNLAAARAYSNNPDVSGMVGAAMRDANQNYSDIQAPAIQRGAAVSGNINSTAPAIEQGILQRGLAQKTEDVSANLRGNLYQQGLQLGQQTQNADNQFRLGGLTAAANGGINAANAGVYANTGAVGQQSGLFNIANTGAQNMLAGNQAPLTNQLQAYNFGQNSPYTALNNFYNLIGNRSWGGTTNGTSVANSSSTPSPMSMISGGIGMLGSLF